MLDRKFIEKILTANGVDPSGPDEVIKSVLISAKWHQSDVDTAIMVLRENNETHEQRVDSFQKVFTSDDRLKPETISSLLGIHVDVPGKNGAPRKNDGYSTSGVFGILIFSLVFAVTFVLSAMWYLEMGPFLIQ